LPFEAAERFRKPSGRRTAACLSGPAALLQDGSSGPALRVRMRSKDSISPVFVIIKTVADQMLQIYKYISGLCHIYFFY
jgi:hypothetical protein